MDGKDLSLERLGGKTVAVLSRALDYRSANHSIISGNLANIDTPGYRPKELLFDKELKKALKRTSIPISSTNQKHFPSSPEELSRKKAFAVVEKDAQVGESNQLNIDMEMAQMAQNNLLYEASVRLLSKRFEALRLAIESTRR